jgi:hypothetical protein
MGRIRQDRMSLTQKWRRLRLLPTFDLKLYWEMAEEIRGNSNFGRNV